MNDDTVIYTRASADDRRWQLCWCAVCQQVARCTPDNDFYGEDGAPLTCEICFRERLRTDEGITQYWRMVV